MSNLVIDFGNSRIKLAVFTNHKLIHSQIYDLLEEICIVELIAKYSIQNSIISSVRADLSIFEEILKSQTNYVRFSAERQKSVTLTYKTPQTLGLDRLAAVIAASSIYPNQNCLVIDAGTCITYDMVNSENIYSGGSISPGLNMRFQAMHSLTGRLPLLVADESFTEYKGNDTETSMRSGVQYGMYCEIIGFIESYYSRFPGLKILLSGGDAKFFDTRLKSSIFAHTLKNEPHLVLIGLNEVIYQQND